MTTGERDGRTAPEAGEERRILGGEGLAQVLLRRPIGTAVSKTMMVSQTGYCDEGANVQHVSWRTPDWRGFWDSAGAGVCSALGMLSRGID